MDQTMIVKFWGVRGSIPSPGVSTVRYGGNTSCVSIDFFSNKLLILDAGTGIRELGKSLEKKNSEYYILLTHNHWDHIQGFPYFSPLYKKNQRIFTFPILHGEELICSLLEQMDGTYFPLDIMDLPSQYECIPRKPITFLREQGLDISQIATNHPGGGYGYRIRKLGKSVVYITDNELYPPYNKNTEFEEFVRFCSFADVLIHDSQYIEQDMPYKHGWGHSLVSQTCELALAADVKHVILFHHDPERNDEELDVIQKKAQSWFEENNAHITCTAAFEGMELML
jgi:phosphoribosyl 1,2-cyclic phosphodiesterase